jgi:dipeptidase E
MKNAIFASSSTIHGSSFLEYLLEELESLFKHANTITFIPYARPSGISFDAYTSIAANALSSISKKVIGLHDFKDPIDAINAAEAIFVGGGNTFVLLDTLIKNNLLMPLKAAIENGTPYLGTSAGSNICGVSIKTTNDMPIVYPKSFNALNILPFNLNPHYIEPDANSKHKGETRDTRIKEFHFYNITPVIGLREGSWLSLNNNAIVLNGTLKARVFEQQKAHYEIPPGTNLNVLN